MTSSSSPSPMARNLALAAVVGTVLFGVAIFAGRHYPRWTGAVLTIGPPIMGILLARQRSDG